MYYYWHEVKDIYSTSLTGIIARIYPEVKGLKKVRSAIKLLFFQFSKFTFNPAERLLYLYLCLETIANKCMFSICIVKGELSHTLFSSLFHYSAHSLFVSY